MLATALVTPESSLNASLLVVLSVCRAKKLFVHGLAISWGVAIRCEGVAHSRDQPETKPRLKLEAETRNRVNMNLKHRLALNNNLVFFQKSFCRRLVCFKQSKTFYVIGLTTKAHIVQLGQIPLLHHTDWHLSVALVQQRPLLKGEGAMFAGSDELRSWTFVDDKIG